MDKCSRVYVSSIGGVTKMRILGAPPQPASMPSAGWGGAPKIRILDDSPYTTSESTPAQPHSELAVRLPLTASQQLCPRNANQLEKRLYLVFFPGYGCGN